MKLFSNALAPVEPLNNASSAERRAEAWLESRLKRGETERFIEHVPHLTPQMAALLLKLNTTNRRFRRAAARKYLRIMQEGRWKLTNQCISISKLRRLIDGQHRLWAVNEFGLPVPFLIGFGCEDEEFYITDGGEMRNGADLIDSASMDYGKARSAAAKLLYILQERRRETPDAARVLMMAETHDNPVMTKALPAGTALGKNGFAASAATLAYYQIARHSPHAERLDQFWAFLRSGVDAPPVVAKLRDSALARRLTGKSNSREAAIKQAAAIILTWNMWLQSPKRAVDLTWGHVVELPEVR